ncbi:hypothetical protein [Stenomitos frigidus]|uniref:hypothetical protein n=1 Tax=Stenomitos frigidus TaxID=1886765 RepID=UPI00329A3CE1
MLDEVAKGMNCDLSHILNEAIDLYLESKKLGEASSQDDQFDFCNRLLQESFPVRSKEDASWIVTEEDSLAEFQSRIHCLCNIVIDNRGAKLIINDLKIGYSRTGVFDWWTAEDVTGLYLQFGEFSWVYSSFSPE